MAKWKKLKLIKIKSPFKPFYRFHIIITKDNFLKLIHPQAYNIVRDNDIIECDMNKKGIKQIIDEGIETIKVIDHSKNFLHNIVYNHIVILVSLITIFFIFLTSSLFIRDISFKDSSKYDYDVYTTVKHHIKQIGPFNILDCKLNDLGNELRTTYPHFAYIGVLKVGAKIVIEIEKQEVPIISDKDENSFGDIIAMYDGYITGVEVKKGILCVTTSQSVKKGELLISGNLDYKTNPSSNANYVHARGKVIAKVATYEKIKVPKNVLEERYTGNQHKHYVINAFNKSLEIGNNKNLNIGHEVITEIFNLGNIFGIYQVNSYDLSKVTISYDEESALNFAKSKIQYDFSLMISTDEEKILSIDLVMVEENDEYFEFNFLVRAIRDIGTFRKLN